MIGEGWTSCSSWPSSLAATRDRIPNGNSAEIPSVHSDSNMSHTQFLGH